MADISRRCGCRDEDGKQYGPRCPKLRNSRHGRWSFRLSAGSDPKTGRRRYVTKGGFGSYEEAKSEKLAAEKRIHAGTYRFEKQKLGDYLTQWLDRVVKNDELKPSTAVGYRRYIADISDKIGHLQVNAIRKAHIADLIEELVEEGRGATAIRRAHATLRSALNDALERDLIDYNPAARVKLPRIDKQPIRPWEPEEAGQFLDVAAEHRLGALFEAAILTGLRRGELVGLRWQDVDLANRRLTVSVQVVRVGTAALEGTIKTEAGQSRVVPLGDRAVGALVAWQIQQSTERIAWADAYRDSGRVFTMEDGRELRPEYPSRLFEQLQSAAGMRPQRFHDLRHLFASLALSNGEDMAVVSKIMGHSTSQITRDLYGHLVGDKARQAVSGVASLLPPRSGVLTTVITENQKAPLGSS